jgi:hypothetical protein
MKQMLKKSVQIVIQLGFLSLVFLILLYQVDATTRMLDISPLHSFLAIISTLIWSAFAAVILAAYLAEKDK